MKVISGVIAEVLKDLGGKAAAFGTSVKRGRTANPPPIWATAGLAEYVGSDDASLFCWTHRYASSDPAERQKELLPILSAFKSATADAGKAFLRQKLLPLDLDQRKAFLKGYVESGQFVYDLIEGDPVPGDVLVICGLKPLPTTTTTTTTEPAKPVEPAKSAEPAPELSKPAKPEKGGRKK